MQELIGRFSKMVAMNSLSKESLKEIILYSDFSPLNTYKKLFEQLQIQFEYDDEFVDWLAEKTEELDTDARSIKTLFDDCISSALFHIFAGEYDGISLTRPDREKDRAYTLSKHITK